MLAGSRAHLREVGEAYFEHMRFAARVGAMMVAAGLACMLHALVPALCTRTASRTIERLHRILQERGALERDGAGEEAAAFARLAALSLAAAAAPWVAGAHPAFAAPLALLALAFPLAFIVTYGEGAAEFR